jgi:hypothetical protein
LRWAIKNWGQRFRASQLKLFVEHGQELVSDMQKYISALEKYLFRNITPILIQPTRHAVLGQ